MQTIFIDELKVSAHIGVGSRERGAPQTLSVDIEIGVPDDRACLSDRLGDTIDYAAVAALVKAECATQRFALLERLARHLCDAIDAAFRTGWIRIRIAKAGIVPDATRVGVTLERGMPPQPGR